MEKKPSKNIFNDPQNIIALAVSLISICALFVSIKQTQIMSEQRVLMYEQAKASVWPRLDLGRNKSHDPKKNNHIDRYGLTLTNAGVGPAIISDVRFSYEGKIAKNWWALFQNFNLPDSVETYISNSNISNSLVKIGEDIRFLNLDGNLPLAQYFFKHDQKIKIEIWYTSIYEDKWKLTYYKGKCVTEEVDADFELEKEEQFEN